MVPRTAGGIRRLCELIDEHGDDLEADFAQFYSGLDITDVWRGRLSPRRVLVLASRLASIAGSRYRATALGGPEWMNWGTTEGLLADLNDALVDNSVVTIKAAGGKTKRPELYPRPTSASAPEDVVAVPSIDDFPIHMVIGMTQKK